MIEIVQSPNETTNQKGIRLFLAGGISNCPNWQDIIIEKLKNDERLKDKNVIVFNPRCKTIPEEEPQVTWEYKKIKVSHIVSFWFSEGSPNSITLFEYGSHFKSRKKIIVGCHPNYPRKSNVVIQTKLVKPNFKINESFESFYEQIIITILKQKI
jgi:hypothetical protein